jgi:uncharacterized protein YbaA (DUF1428 family)
MAKYCFFVVMPVPKDKIEKWKEVGALSSQIFRDHGAVATYDWIADMEACPMGEVTSFQRSVQATDDEVIGIAQVIFESKEASAAVNAAYEADPRMSEMSFQYDPKRAYYGGFEMLG